MIIYGIRSTNIGSFEISNTICDQCAEQETQDITVFGRYFHVFWIPIFPLGKTVVGECCGCFKTLKKRKFSPQLKRGYEQHKKKAKRPIWHWAGSMIIAVLLLWIFLIAGTGKSDSRSELLQADLNAMVLNPTYESDSLSFVIKQIMDDYILEEMQPQKFKYFSKIEDSKVLVLMKIPRLRKAEKAERLEVLNLIETVMEATPLLYNKDIYIGVQGRISIMIVKTPTTLKNGRFISESSLYEFYGKKTEDNKLEE